MNLLCLVGLVTLLQTTPTISLESFLEDVRRLASANTNEARFEALTTQLRERNIPFTVEPFTIDKTLKNEPRTEGRNVVVTVGEGSDQIVIGAHYDAVRLPDGSLSRGAVDNAASSVILVRLAEALRSESLSKQVKIVWFDMEELGLIGSSRYVQAHSADRITAMLNFDVNAYGDTVLFGPADRKEAASLKRTLIETCAAEAIDCVGFAEMPPGDDKSFVKANVPTISVALLPRVEVHQLWLMMNAGQGSGLAQGHTPAILQTIHTRDDTPDKVNAESMARMLRFALGLVRNLVRG